jgi:hypothetical protein
MAIVAWCNAVVRLCRQNLVGFEFAVGTTCVRISRLEKPAAAATAVVVRPVRVHVDKILFTHNRFHRVPQIFGHRIAKALSNQLAGVLDRKLKLKILVPIGVDLQLSLFDPLGIKLDDTLYFKVVLNFKFFQSDPDCK